MRYTHLASLKPDRFDINCILETVLTEDWGDYGKILAWDRWSFNHKDGEIPN